MSDEWDDIDVVHILGEDGRCRISLNGQGHLPCSQHGIQDEPDYSPTTFLDTMNTLASYRPAGLTHPHLDSRQIGEFQAERMLEGGYVIRYDPARAQRIIEGRKS